MKTSFPIKTTDGRRIFKNSARYDDSLRRALEPRRYPPSCYAPISVERRSGRTQLLQLIGALVERARAALAKARGERDE